MSAEFGLKSRVEDVDAGTPETEHAQGEVTWC